MNKAITFFFLLIFFHLKYLNAEIIYEKNNFIITNYELETFKNVYNDIYLKKISDEEAIKNIILISNLIDHIKNNNPQYLNNLDLKNVNLNRFPMVKLLNLLPKTHSLFETVIVSANDKLVELFLDNKIKFTEPAEFTTPSDLLPFSAQVVREILSANKGSEGTASLSNKGLLKIVFNTDSSLVEYFVVRQQ